MPSKTDSNLPKAPLLEGLSLRDYQSRAIDDLRRYLACYHGGETRKSALVHMPTGSGKTGIIACLSRCLPTSEVGSVLLLTPRTALRKQLKQDVEGRFFSMLKHGPKEPLPKTVVELDGEWPAYPHRLSSRRDFFGRHIFVSTMQMLDTMRKTAESSSLESSTSQRKIRFYQQLLQYTSLVLVDEGHYEPATSWGLSVRQFESPKILFTATPYRNDLKTFDVDLEHWILYTYREAVNDHYLRNVAVRQRKPTRDPEEFADDLLRFYEKYLDDPLARAIIRCDNQGSIRLLASVLQQRRASIGLGSDVVAIHEKLGGTEAEEWERRTVPDREKENEEWYYRDEGPRFWIHQFKLLEGIDDSRFQLVAMFEPLRNLRSLVQQVGRVVRNPNHPKPGTAYLLDHADKRMLRRWESYRRFDEKLYDYYQEPVDEKVESEAAERDSQHPLEGFNQKFFETFLKELLERHPTPAYIEREIRDRFSFERFKPVQELLLPRSVNLFRKKRTFDSERLLDAIEAQLEEEDRVFRPYPALRSTVVYVYFTVRNPPFLGASYFLECSPGVIVLHETRGLVGFYDSGGVVPLSVLRFAAGPGLRPKDLRRVFRDREESHLVKLALKNSNLGHRAVRWRAFSAASVRETVPLLDDYGHIVSTATGYSAEDSAENQPGGDSSPQYDLRRRYVGFNTGRISESGERVDVAQYVTWVDELAEQVSRRQEGLPTFARYASDKVTVRSTTAKNILLDVFEVQDQFFTVKNEELGIERGEPMRLEDRCQDVKVQRAGTGGVSKTRQLITIRANGHPCEIEVHYDRNRRRYSLASPELDRMYYKAQGKREGLVAYLNREQSFRILPRSRNAIYVDGEFYRPAVEFGSKFDANAYHVGKILHPAAVLRRVKSEKGKKVIEDSWEPKSLFGIIASLGEGHEDLQELIGQPDIVICDDPGTEVADFILADTEQRRVVFIHAKGLRQKERFKPYSASKLADVCGQTVKNIRYLSMFNELKPKNIEQWSCPWSVPHVEGEVPSHIIRPEGEDNAEGLWEEIQGLIANPLTAREVWLLLGQILSKKRLEQELRKEPPTAEAVQAVMQLRSTLATVGSIDAKLRVLCSP